MANERIWWKKLIWNLIMRNVYENTCCASGFVMQSHPHTYIRVRERASRLLLVQYFYFSFFSLYHILLSASDVHRLRKVLYCISHRHLFLLFLLSFFGHPNDFPIIIFCSSCFSYFTVLIFWFWASLSFHFNPILSYSLSYSVYRYTRKYTRFRLNPILWNWSFDLWCSCWFVRFSLQLTYIIIQPSFTFFAIFILNTV